MSDTAIAIYENGTLRLLTPLALPERSRVQVQIERVLIPEDAAAHRRQVHQALVVAALSLPDGEAVSGPAPLSAERREELARRFAQGQPLSEQIMADREGR